MSDHDERTDDTRDESYRQTDDSGTTTGSEGMGNMGDAGKASASPGREQGSPSSGAQEEGQDSSSGDYGQSGQSSQDRGAAGGSFGGGSGAEHHHQPGTGSGDPGSTAGAGESSDPSRAGQGDRSGRPQAAESGDVDSGGTGHRASDTLAADQAAGQGTYSAEHGVERDTQAGAGSLGETAQDGEGGFFTDPSDAGGLLPDVDDTKDSKGSDDSGGRRSGDGQEDDRN